MGNGTGQLWQRGLVMPISGIAGSIAGRGVWEAGRHAYQTAAHWRYAQLFGSDATSGRLHLVVGALVPPACQDQAGNPSRLSSASLAL